jgi:hypothetical protein
MWISYRSLVGYNFDYFCIDFQMIQNTKYMHGYGLQRFHHDMHEEKTISRVTTDVLEQNDQPFPVQNAEKE